MENFISQWLRLRDLESVNPDNELFANYRPALMGFFREEIRLFVGSIITEKRAIHDLLTADHTFLNEELSRHYGFGNIKGDHFRRVKLEQEERYGLLGKGGVQMVTPYANRTTPVIRGAYILENFQGVPPANPPPNVEAFPEAEEGAMQAPTVRSRLETHRDNPACAGCHGSLGPGAGKF